MSSSCPRVGLACYHCATGLGVEALRLWRRLPIARWLVAPHPRLGIDDLDGLPRPEGITVADSAEHVAEFLGAVDVVLCPERPLPGDLFARARRAGKRTVLLVNAEWCLPHLPDAATVDLYIARTRQGLACVRAWAPERVVCLPAPLDLVELPYRRRDRAERFLWAGGWGGVANRKGWPAVKEALALDHGLPLELRAQAELDTAGLPAGVEVLGSVGTPAELYQAADVAVVPSRWEGCGLQALEALACGLPVLVPAGPPLAEYVLDAFGDSAAPFILPAAQNSVELWGRPWPAWDVDPAALARQVRALQGRSIAALSQRARDYVERVHGPRAWRALWAAVLGELG